MGEHHNTEATFIGQVASVRGGVVTVRLRATPTTLVLVGGNAYRVGEVGAFVRIPLGYNQLIGICTQIGADAIPQSAVQEEAGLLEQPDEKRMHGYRWMTVALCGEVTGGHFERGVGQYPTVGDEVHLVMPDDINTIYGDVVDRVGLTVGRIAGSDGLPAILAVEGLVSRHGCVVGSTGAGKSNLVSVLLEELASDTFPTARVLVIDPHGEYGDALGTGTKKIVTGPEHGTSPNRLRVPYWALPFEQLLDLTMGALQPNVTEAIRDRVRDLKVEAASHLAFPPNRAAITASSPIPFSIRRLWFELEDTERATFDVSNGQSDDNKCTPTTAGDAASLTPPEYPPATSYNQAPYVSKQRRNIGRQLDLLHSRLTDTRFGFMFDANDPLHPDLDGRITEDLDSLVASWIGNDEPVTVVDVSGIPGEVSGAVVGTMAQLAYDTLYWGMELPVGGKQQPLLIVVDEAHRFLPATGESPATVAFSRIAKEGRKYGVGLLVVTQRPSDVSADVLSQCGTMVALRVTSQSDKGAVSAVAPDDLGGLVGLLPVLRTGEALVLGEAISIPSRVRIRRATRKPTGEDPPLPQAWRQVRRPDREDYASAIAGWRGQSTAIRVPPPETEENNNA